MEKTVFDVNLDSNDLQVLHHHRYDDGALRLKSHLMTKLSSPHFALFSSGTTSDLKGYALSKEALWANAKAVNEHFALTPQDVWGLSLPTYHVGGLSVLVRAKLLGNEVVDLRKWEPTAWVRKIEDRKVSITTIVPTQLFDLISLGLKSPTSLRYLIVGGDFLSHELELRALKLGWPVIRTYGMSEVCSQLASSKMPASHDMEILPIHQAKISDEGRLLVKSEALFTLEFKITNSVETKDAKEFLDHEGFYPTQDRARLAGNLLYPEGRLDDQVKVSGHMVNLTSIKNDFYKFLLEENLFGTAELILEDDERKGKKLILITTREDKDASVWERLKNLIRPVVIDEIKLTQNFQRTDLGKLKKNQ